MKFHILFISASCLIGQCQIFFKNNCTMKYSDEFFLDLISFIWTPLTISFIWTNFFMHFFNFFSYCGSGSKLLNTKVFLVLVNTLHMQGLSFWKTLVWWQQILLKYYSILQHCYFMNKNMFFLCFCNYPAASL